MRKILMVDECGCVVNRFDTVKDAAIAVGITPPSVLARIKKRMVVNGFALVYGDEALRSENGGVVFEGRRGRDELSAENLEKVYMKAEARGMRLERVEYVLRCGVVPIKPCTKVDCKSDFSRPMVGGMECAMCRFFRGKCKETRTVLCAYKQVIRKTGERVRL